MSHADLGGLTVRPIRDDERATWDGLMSEHHYLQSHRLVGESMRYVAILNEQWTALLGWTSAAFKLAARDAWIGWSEQQRLQRLKVVANNARLLILPGAHIRNLASKALALNLKRLSADWVKAYGHPIMLAETFVDHPRFTGTCYRAAGFVPIGATKGFGISAGSYYFHGNPKTILVRLLQRNVREWLTAPFVHPSLMEGSTAQPLLNLNRLNVFGDKGLLDELSIVPDWRSPRGTRHSRAIVLAMVVCAQIANVGNTYLDVGRWIKTLSENTLREFGCPRTYGAPSESTIRRAMQVVDVVALCQVVDHWLSKQGHHRVVDTVNNRLQALRSRSRTRRRPQDPEAVRNSGGER